VNYSKDIKTDNIFDEVTTEIKFATGTHHRINQNDVQCVHPANERPTTVVYTTSDWPIAPLISSWLIMSQQLFRMFQMVDVLHLLSNISC